MMVEMAYFGKFGAPTSLNDTILGTLMMEAFP